MKKILITGANGLVGRHLCLRLARCGWNVHAAVRAGKIYRELAEHTTVHPVGDIASNAEWNQLLPDMDVVVHLAARVHIIKETSPNAAAEYHHINTTGTELLARAAAQHGVAHFVYLSTVKVQGEHNLSGPYSESDPPAPRDPYSASKWDAECALAAIAAGTSTAVTCLRPPLIYGPGVKGNFLRLMNLVYRRAPLPLASVNNSRSLLYVGNLVSAIEKLLAVPAAGRNTFLISDDHDISTPQLITMIAAALGVKTRLFRCPLPMLLALGKIAGKGGEITRMVESLSIDCSHIKRQLEWVPPFTIEHGLKETARWFLDAKK